MIALVGEKQNIYIDKTTDFFLKINPIGKVEYKLT
jgi:hypothetical protein